MPITTTQQQQAIIRRSFIGRIVATVAFILLTLGMVITRLYWLQVTNHEVYTTLSTENRIRLLPLPPTRGEITDRNGVLLAQNIPSIDLFIYPDKVKNIEETIEQLSKVVSNSLDSEL